MVRDQFKPNPDYHLGYCQWHCHFQPLGNILDLARSKPPTKILGQVHANVYRKGLLPKALVLICKLIGTVPRGTTWKWNTSKSCLPWEKEEHILLLFPFPLAAEPGSPERVSDPATWYRGRMVIQRHIQSPPKTPLSSSENHFPGALSQQRKWHSLYFNSWQIYCQGEPRTPRGKWKTVGQRKMCIKSKKALEFHSPEIQAQVEDLIRRQ